MKIVSLFLIGMLVLAMFGRLRLPRPGGKPLKMSRPSKCPHCGRYKIGKGPCSCRKG